MADAHDLFVTPLRRRTFLASALTGVGAALFLASCSDDDDSVDGPSGSNGTGTGTTGASGDSGTGDSGGTTASTIPTPTIDGNPFTLGVASGDPLPDSVILWTRLAPKPTEGGGMPDAPAPVAWEVAIDEAFTQMTASGTAIAQPSAGHSVHVDVKGLKPATKYFYRFKVGTFTSPIGRTKSAALPTDAVATWKFAFASCQDYQNGLYAAWRDAATQDLDAIVFLGDYIYEDAPGDAPGGVGPGGASRRHTPGETETLQQYRDRYALYRTDADLQAAHAACPWVITWDDHEVQDNYSGDVGKKHPDKAAWRERRAHAYQAWYEHMPVRLPAPAGPDYQIYRDLTFGNLVHLYILDGRQYRTEQPCRDEGTIADFGATCDAASDPNATMLGAAQEQWLLDTLTASKATWNIMGNDVMICGYDFSPEKKGLRLLDGWDGYRVQRQRVIEGIAASKAQNPVVITGDIHSSWVADVKPDPTDPASPVVATEFVGSSITSSFPIPAALVSASQSVNPHVKYFDVAHGYVLCTVAADKLTAEYRVVADISDAKSAVTTGATFVVNAGTPGAQKV